MSADIIVIDDISDPRVDDFRNIKDVERRRGGTFIAESEMVIRRLFTSRFAVRSVLLTPSRVRRLQDELATLPDGVPVFMAEPHIVDELVGYPLHRGGMALGERIAHVSWQSMLTPGDHTMVILENVVDPDNVGAVFRHCAAFGVTSVLLSPHAGDPLYRKSVRASMGWSLHVRWTRVPDHEWPAVLIDMRTDGWNVVALTPDALALPLSSSPGDTRTALLLGSEHEGLTTTAMDAATSRRRIAMAPGVDSLNVATTAAIALYELTRNALPVSTETREPLGA